MRSCCRVKHALLIGLSLLAGATASLAAWQYARAIDDQRLKASFDGQVTQYVSAIEERLGTYEQVLRAGVAMYRSQQEVTREEWREFVQTLNTVERYPGIQGVGLALQLRHDGLAAHEAWLRSQGQPDYRVYPLNAQVAPTATVFLEPEDARNRRAIGYDMASHPVRREAMFRARDTGQPALSGRVILVQELDKDVQAGTLLYVPLYRKGLPLNTLAERRAAHLGWVYSPFRMNDLMQGTLGAGVPDVRLSLFDGGQASPGSMLYESAQPEIGSVARFVATLGLDVAGHQWTVVVESLPDFTAGAYTASNIVLLGGGLVTVLISMIIGLLARAERRARGLAREMTMALRSSEEHKQAVLQSTADGIITIDAYGRIRSFNSAAERMFQRAAEEVLGHGVEMLMPARVRAEHRERLQRLRHAPPEQDRRVRIEAMGLRKDGVEFPIEVAINPLPSGSDVAFVAMVSDITERKQAEAVMHHMAQHDALTDLPNRSLLLDRLEQAIARARRQHEQVAVLMFDLDHFKRINDSLGHQIGDALLLQVAQRLSGVVRASDTVARMGGDEFVIVLPGLERTDTVDTLLEDLLASMSRPFAVARHELTVTPSIGVCFYPRDGQSAVELIKHADTAMYQAKEAGRGTFRHFSSGMLRRNERRLKTENALRKALSAQQLSLDLQPQVAFDTGQMLGVEALLRWHHPSLGRVPPNDFVPLAEEMGLIHPIGEWVIRESCRQGRALIDALGRPLSMAVNISPRQFFYGDLIDIIEEGVAEAAFPAEKFEVEITEGALIENTAEAIAVFQRLRDIGVRIAIDDFGTGYSSLSYLTRFPIDKLKIDQTFVRDVTIDANDAAVTSAIIVMAHALNLTVVAEGIENQAQFGFLAERGCDLAQGYYLGEPMPLQTLIARFGSVPPPRLVVNRA